MMICAKIMDWRSGEVDMKIKGTYADLGTETLTIIAAIFDKIARNGGEEAVTNLADRLVEYLPKVAKTAVEKNLKDRLAGRRIGVVNLNGCKTQDQAEQMIRQHLETLGIAPESLDGMIAECTQKLNFGNHFDREETDHGNNENHIPC